MYLINSSDSRPERRRSEQGEVRMRGRKSTLCCHDGATGVPFEVWWSESSVREVLLRGRVGRPEQREVMVTGGTGFVLLSKGNSCRGVEEHTFGRNPLSETYPI